MMRAFAFDAYKKPVHEVEIAEPELGNSDILVKVEAVGLNLLDEKIRDGEFRSFLPYRTPLVLGHDVAGTVIGVGDAVRRFSVGDRVFARVRDHRIGTLAERIAIEQADAAFAPSTIGVVEAASLPLVALTAWQALVDIGRVTAGQKVLIHAGAGGVGTIAIQLAKHLGAHVATTASARNHAFLRELGADVVIDYRAQDFASQLEDYDFVLDSLGGDNLRASLSVLARGGVAVGISGPPTPAFAERAGLNPLLRLVMAFLSRAIRKAAARRGVRYEFLFMQADGGQLGKIAELVDAGVIRPVVGQIYPFVQTPAALASLHGARTRGKTVVSVP